MFREKLASIKSELLSYSPLERLIVLCCMICSFCITSEYAVTKPTSNSVFITHYTVKWLPYAWLATVPLNLLVVSLYNRFLPVLGCFRLFLLTVGTTLGVNLLSAGFIGQVSFLPFILYIWKDIYVLLMFQQLWSVIHAMTKMSRAKYLYGILFGVGGLGSIVGSMIPSFFAVKIGSENLLFSTIPIYAVFIFAYFFLLKHSGFLHSHKQDDQLRMGPKHTSQGFSLIRTSRALKFILLIVVLMQLSTTVMDYQFNTFLQNRIPDQNLRTQFSGRLWGMINTINLCLQFVASFLLVQFLGLRRSHILIPGILFVNAVGYLMHPTFAMITYSFSVIKTFDYSIFNIIKEMLYVPLKTGEKFHAKAIIDVFAYRSAKALASVVVILLQVFCPLHLPYAFSWAHVVLFFIWIASVVILLKEEKPQEAQVV